ncbi:MarR family winged helix-turn-helix transcriptional regulator [Enterococcus alishanensis]|uniref:MarR family transcriptional regulator n=1 Tax=Enterococcus alishanensis TaxID=1303817 RepID=A0ABS6THD9_9ENTE|nr:MarR family transcriptional regulator [Enterococcus alishanensis]MBV7392242.1 MarR family transcriptional regulator [Enterococcus alishanensis]
MGYSNFSDRPNIERIAAIANKFNLSSNPDSVHLYLQFQQTYREIEKEYNQLLEKYKLSESRFSILMFLSIAENEKLLPSEIADKLNVTRPTASKLIKGMNSKGLITIQQSSTDKRTSFIKITLEGKNLLQTFLPYNYQAVDSLFDGFSAEERNQLSYLLEKLANNKSKLKKLEDTKHANS